MPGPHWTVDELVLMAGLAAAAYEADSNPAVTALRCTWVGQLGDDQCQATLARWGQYFVVALQGTRVTADPSIPELWDDIDCIPVGVDGGHAHAGFWRPLEALWPSIAAKLPGSGPRLILGHSLGGVRAHLAKALCPDALVVSFGAPKGADAAFWHKAFMGPPPTRVVAGADFAPAWPPEEFTQPGPMLWLNDGRAVEAARRAVLPISIADHDLTGSYLRRLSDLPPDQVIA